MREMRRKCFKCGSSPAKDPSVVLYRFPKPGRTNSLRCELWAKYIFPNGPWSSTIFQKKLYSEHRMLCDKHFKPTSFLVFRAKKLGKFAAPDDEGYDPIRQKKVLVDNTYGNTDDVEPSNLEDNIDYNADDDVVPESRLFSWQKDTEVDCDDFHDSDSNVKQAETCQNIKEPCPITENTSDERDDETHEGYRCDMCKGPIYKFRYACVQCVNFDLCGACEGRTAHAQHYLLRVPSPKPYGEIKQVMDTIRRILSADIKSFQTEVNYANELLDDMKSEVVSYAGSDPCPDEPDFPIPADDSSCDEDVEMCNYSNPSHEPEIENEGNNDGNTESTLQADTDHEDNVDDTEIDWLDDDILEDELNMTMMTYQSCTKHIENTENDDKTHSNDQHTKKLNEIYHNKLKPVKREVNKINNHLSPSNASGKVSKRIYGVVRLPNIISNSTNVAKILKTVKHSLESKVSINMERLSDEEIKLATNS